MNVITRAEFNLAYFESAVQLVSYYVDNNYNNNNNKEWKLFGWLVGFYGISTFVGYLIPNPF